MHPIRARHVPRSIARGETGPLCLLVTAVMALVLVGLLLARPADDTRQGFLVARHSEVRAPHS